MLQWIKYYVSGQFFDLNISSDMNVPDISSMGFVINPFMNVPDISSMG